MNRREFIAASVGVTTAGLAGCRSMFETRSARSPPVVEDRPDAVYHPTHVEGMQMVDVTTAGDYRVALTYSFPHRFWTVDGDSRNKVEIDGDHSVHLMTTVWDDETGLVVPNNSISATVTTGGTAVADRQLWPMLSQNMSVHAGDNVGLDGDDTYEVEVEIAPVPDRTTGAFTDRFDDLVTATFEFEFSQSKLEETTFRRLEEKEGDRGAVDPMEMEMLPVARAPAPGDLPGTLLGEPTSSDATFVTTRLDSPPVGVETDDTGSDDGTNTDGEDEPAYLAVSPRTPYNAYPLPFMGLSATVSRDGESVFADPLLSAFDPDLGYHYGAVVPGIEEDDGIALSVDTSPQIARHEGYETAFFDFSGMELTV